MNQNVSSRFASDSRPMWSRWYGFALIAAGVIVGLLTCFTAPLESVIVKDLVPHIDGAYRTIATREGRMLDGFSMGGYGSARLSEHGALGLEGRALAPARQARDATRPAAMPPGQSSDAIIGPSTATFHLSHATSGLADATGHLSRATGHLADATIKLSKASNHSAGSRRRREP